MKKTTNKILEANEGLHSSPNYRKARKMLTNHTFRNARLYSLVLKGSTNKADYRYAIDRLCEKLRDNGMPCEWKAAYEMDEEKGLHLHLYILIESANHVPCSIIRYRENGWLTQMLAKRGLSFYISKPLNPIHRINGRQVNYAYIPRKGEKLEDALVWISYAYKVRSKAGVEGTIYASSRTKKAEVKKAEPVVPEAPAACTCMNSSEKEINAPMRQAVVAKLRDGCPQQTAHYERIEVRKDSVRRCTHLQQSYVR